MTRSSKKDMVDLNPVYRDNSIKIDKVTISFEKSGSAKVRFTDNGKTFSHGVGRLDNDIYKERIITACKDIAIDLRRGKFNQRDMENGLFWH